MRQRAKHKKKSAIAIAAAVAGGAVLLGLIFFGGATVSLLPSRGHGKFAPFPTRGFVENPRSYAGNKYRVKGTVDNMLDSVGTGEKMNRLVSLSVGEGMFIPVMVPSSSLPSFS